MLESTVVVDLELNSKKSQEDFIGKICLEWVKIGFFGSEGRLCDLYPLGSVTGNLVEIFYEMSIL